MAPNHMHLFRERLSYQRGEAYAIMGNGDFTVLWLELKMFRVQKETAQTHVFIIFTYSLLDIVNLNQAAPNCFYP